MERIVDNLCVGGVSCEDNTIKIRILLMPKKKGFEKANRLKLKCNALSRERFFLVKSYDKQASIAFD